MQVAIDLPKDFVEMLTEEAIAKEMRLIYALALFKDARVTACKAAELAGMDIYGFVSACKAHQIPVIDASREELIREMQSTGKKQRSWSPTTTDRLRMDFWMQAERFDLNDIEHEPSDRQLESLMELVAEEARRRAEEAREAMMASLRAEIAAAREREITSTDNQRHGALE